MLRALVRDLAEVPDVETVVAYDPQVSLGELPARLEMVDARDVWQSWRRIASEVDVVWPIAPETDGVLERAAALARDTGRPVLASDIQALAMARSKQATARRLAECGVPAVACEPLDGPEPPSGHGWVVKPDDGAGCTDTYFAADREALMGWRRRLAGRNFVVQPFLAGPALSLSMLAQDGQAWLLACNTQRMRRENGTFTYTGGLVGGAEALRPALEPVAAGVAAALPGLWGYIGVDLIDSPQGPTVLEINPRLTTSYVGLAESLDINPAALVLALRTTKLSDLMRPLRPRPVEIEVPSAP
ncbi:MAG: ATP-grasp domain-containing protein [Alphaproteobacteria bacterium]|nr:ATP-grasp domain-containing protein [Alphaproteobacteria bacterium]